jgi:predicted GH43/DUF377 family glycosyl hydrolase
MSYNIIKPTTLIGNYCFNGSIFVKYKYNIEGNSELKEVFSHKIPDKNYTDLEIYCVYRSTHVRFGTLKSTIHFTPINLETFEGDINKNKIIFENSENEDPRVLCINNKLFVSYSRIITPMIRKYIKQFFIKIEGTFFDTNFEKIDKLINFEKLNSLNITQKNWTFFEQNGLIYILYNVMPLQIYIWNPIYDLLESLDIIPLIFRTWKHPKYTNLVLRGGCQPIKIDDIFYVFAHSTDYAMYCFTLDSSNFDILKITLEELIHNKGNKQDIHFPCGVIYDEVKKIFHVSLGINDSNLAIFTISKDDLDNKMIKVPNFNSVIMKDDVWMDHMKNSNMKLWINSWGGCGNDLLSLYCQQNNLVCRSLAWDKLGCHYVKYVNIPLKKIYIILDPLMSLATMNKTSCLKTNFYKLSNQNIDSNQYSLTGLLYFMWIQLLNWYDKPDVFIVKESNLRNKFIKLQNYIGCHNNFFNNYLDIDKNIEKSIIKIEEITNILEKENNFVCNYIYQKIIEIFNKIE